MNILLDGNHLTLKEIQLVLANKATVTIHEKAWENVKNSRAVVEKLIEEKKVIYGVNTGFGKFSDTVISNEDLEHLQINLIRSHACGVGKAFSEDICRLMLLLRANALAKGFSGIRPETLQLLVDCLNFGISPVIPSQGSLGASGDRKSVV